MANDVSLSLLDEFCIPYRKTASPVFRLDGQVKRVQAYKVTDDGFPKLRVALSDKMPFIYSMTREIIDDRSIFIIRGYCAGVSREANLPFVTEADDKYAVLFYVISSFTNGGGLTSPDSHLAIESISVGNNSMEFALKCLKQAYKNDRDFRMLKSEKVVFRTIPNYKTCT